VPSGPPQNEEDLSVVNLSKTERDQLFRLQKMVEAAEEMSDEILRQPRI
jgi:hypothetical protein